MSDLNLRAASGNGLTRSLLMVAIAIIVTMVGSWATMGRAATNHPVSMRDMTALAAEVRTLSLAVTDLKIQVSVMNNELAHLRASRSP